jgi:RHS repeat-associated protein
VYDGNDVVLTIIHGSNWFVRGRYLSGGLDQPLAGRFASTVTGMTKNLALVVDWQGTAMAAMRSDGTQEADVTYLARSAYGSFEATVPAPGGTNPEAGYTGASAPNATGGFVYLRSRWYDPKTGRFLTQDPIGLAGGVNLYAYAGNNPVTFTDPFGLCTDKDGKALPKEQCRDVTTSEGQNIYDKAIESGSWTYCRTAAQKDLPNKKGDCTDYVDAAMDAADLPALNPTVRTGDFASSEDFRVVDPVKEAVQAGDIVVQGGHAGVLSGQKDSRGRLNGTQNGNSATKVIPWGKGVRGLDNVEPVIYRRQVPGN